MNKLPIAIIIGAGPAGLTAAFELATKSNIKPIIFEKSKDIGGIAKTLNFTGNRIDIGGHRFFSKSDQVMKWWLNILPLENDNLATNDNIMLIRNRLSKIYFDNKLFEYPISLSIKTLIKLGFKRIVKIALSYARIKVFPIKNEKSLEDFFINRFGRELYLLFFKDYTEKVWGISCAKIPSDWGRQRIKGLSLSKTFFSAFKSIFYKNNSIDQKNTETSLINRFLYPKLGPGQLWEKVAEIIKEKGGEIYLQHEAIGLEIADNKIKSLKVKDEDTKEIKEILGDYFFSTMAVKDLINSLGDKVLTEIKAIANGLIYRDMIIIGLLLKDMKIKEHDSLLKDNWLYIQEKNIKLGRLQIYNNWSPYMVKDKNTVWLGLEYFCEQGDDLWNKSEDDMKTLAINELVKMHFIDKEQVIDGYIIKMPKAYPAYFGSYDRFDKVKDFTDKFENLFLIGRNGMHRYNNMDHSMLTAIRAVENIKNNIKDKSNIWQINLEQSYNEEKNIPKDNL